MVVPVSMVPLAEVGNTYLARLVFVGRQDLNSRESGNSLDPILSTRRSLLSNLPRLLAALVTVWEAVSREERDPPPQGTGQSQLWVMGAPKVLKEGPLLICLSC